MSRRHAMRGVQRRIWCAELMVKHQYPARYMLGEMGKSITQATAAFDEFNAPPQRSCRVSGSHREEPSMTQPMLTILGEAIRDHMAGCGKPDCVLCRALAREDGE